MCALVGVGVIGCACMACLLVCWLAGGFLVVVVVFVLLLLLLFMYDEVFQHVASLVIISSSNLFPRKRTELTSWQQVVNVMWLDLIRTIFCLFVPSYFLL